MLTLLGTALAAETSGLSSAICTMVGTVKAALGGIMLLLIIMAAAVYAIGQTLGAETRARASVWATAMFTGAIIAGIIMFVAPIIIDIFMAGQISGTGGVATACG
ncbi:MAG: hypothetical protein ACP5NX_00880 [Candidatus Bilamarchaeaceae archaeon]